MVIEFPQILGKLFPKFFKLTKSVYAHKFSQDEERKLQDIIKVLSKNEVAIENSVKAAELIVGDIEKFPKEKVEELKRITAIGPNHPDRIVFMKEIKFRYNTEIAKALNAAWEGITRRKIRPEEVEKLLGKIVREAEDARYPEQQVRTVMEALERVENGNFGDEFNAPIWHRAEDRKEIQGRLIKAVMNGIPNAAREKIDNDLSKLAEKRLTKKRGLVGILQFIIDIPNSIMKILRPEATKAKNFHHKVKSIYVEHENWNSIIAEHGTSWKMKIGPHYHEQCSYKEYKLKMMEEYLSKRGDDYASFKDDGVYSIDSSSKFQPSEEINSLQEDESRKGRQLNLLTFQKNNILPVDSTTALEAKSLIEIPNSDTKRLSQEATIGGNAAQDNDVASATNATGTSNHRRSGSR